jgi:hypothetical protein
MSSYTIECRNKTASELQPSNPNGDWNTNLQEFLEMEEGDSLICRNAFVDTKSITENKIQVESDTTLTIEFVHYNMCPFDTSVQNSADTPHFKAINVAAPSLFVGDEKVYIRCEEKAGSAEDFFLSILSFHDLDDFAGTGGFNVTLVYTDIDGNTNQQKVIYLKSHKAFGGTHTANINQIVKGTGWNIYQANSDGSPNLSQLMWMGNDIQPDPNNRATPRNTLITGVKSAPAGENAIFSPKVFREDILILQGAYTAQDISDRINRAFTQIRGTVSATDLTGTTTILQETTSADKFIECTDGSSATINGFEFDTTLSTPLTGASQVVLDFDIAASRFNWEFLHTPIYQSKNISVGIVNQPNGGTYKIDRYSGIMLTGLFASSELNPKNTDDFWEDKLGFKDFNEFYALQYTIQAGTGTNQHNINGGALASVPVFKTVPAVGLEMTGGFQGVDTVVQKETTDYFAAPKFNAAGSIFATSDNTVPIYATVSVLSDEAQVAFGYFLVSVKAQFKNNFITPNENKNDIVSIVSRYYAKGSYTSASSADSLIYQHRGSPVLLSSFDCRILDSDGNLANNIGGDNTVFLELVKGNPNAAIKTVSKSEDEKERD